MIKFIIKKVLFLFLLLLLSNWGPCNRQEELNISSSELLSNSKNLELERYYGERNPKINNINRIIKSLVGDLKFLSEEEKVVITLLFNSLKAAPIQFDTENIKIHFSKRKNYDPTYYIKELEGNPNLQPNIIRTVKQVIKNRTLKSLKTNAKEISKNKNRLTLQIPLSELFELNKYLILFSEEKLDDKLLAPENLDVNLDIQNGTLDITIKRTLFTNFIHQNISPIFLSRIEQNNIHTLAINKTNLPYTLQNNLEKLIPPYIKDSKEIGQKIEPTYANLFHHLLNNQKQLVQATYNEIYIEKILAIKDIKGTLTQNNISFEIILPNTQEEADQQADQEILKKELKLEIFSDNSLKLTILRGGGIREIDTILNGDFPQPIKKFYACLKESFSEKEKKHRVTTFKNKETATCDYKATLKVINPDLDFIIDTIESISGGYEEFLFQEPDIIYFATKKNIYKSTAEKILKEDYSAKDLVRFQRKLLLFYTINDLTRWRRMENTVFDSFKSILYDDLYDLNPFAVAGSKNVQHTLACIENAINGGTCDYKANLKVINPSLSFYIDKIIDHKDSNFKIYGNLKLEEGQFFITFNINPYYISSNEKRIFPELKEDFSDFSAENLVQSSSNTLTLSYKDSRLTSDVWQLLHSVADNIQNPVTGNKDFQHAFACIKKSGTCDYKATLKAIHPNLSADIDNIKTVNPITYDANNNEFSVIFDSRTSAQILTDNILEKEFSAENLVKSDHLLTLSYTDPKLGNSIDLFRKLIYDDFPNGPYQGKGNPELSSRSKNVIKTLACIVNAKNVGDCDFKENLKVIHPALSSDIDKFNTVDEISINNKKISVIFISRTSEEVIADNILKKEFSEENLVKDSNSNTITLSYTDPSLTESIWKLLFDGTLIHKPVSKSKNIQQALACARKATCDYKATLKVIHPDLSSDINKIKSLGEEAYDASNKKFSVSFNF